ncbi:uncharacterized protein LOC132713558 [Ruditapes philippinarum]|uniref:uncharacterized protein LOC132713558 n=1 Tax=Ruditapes philippinarum TaxID=129788 RepID=UPI00295A5D0D|nr:uncharacterized protein LOC132713558 [Ruditapes philippinarum]
MNNNFISQLKQKSLSNESYTKRFLNWLPFRSKSLKPTSKQLEASSNFDSSQSDQLQEVKIVQDNIQDIIKSIQMLESKTEEVVQKLSQYACTVSEKREAESSAIQVQVYERDMYTADFVYAFKERLNKRFIPDVIKKVSNIDINKPLIILCQKISRLLPDIDYALEQFGELDSFARLAVVIIHNKEEHALPTTSSQAILSDNVKFRMVWIIDTAYTNDLKFYDCKMNNEAIATMTKFLNSDIHI